jgi:hypothetical protein
MDKGIRFKLAEVAYSNEVLNFFNKYLSRNNDAVYSPEFFCPDGVRAAIKSGQVITAMKDNCIIAALRFYRKKKKKCISLYQFAIDRQYRGQGILIKMLESINDVPIEVSCPLSSKFNNYYVKTGWILLDSTEKFNRWSFNKEYKEGLISNDVLPR